MEPCPSRTIPSMGARCCGPVSSQKYRVAKAVHGDLRPRVPWPALGRRDEHRNPGVKQADENSFRQTASEGRVPPACGHRTDHRPPQERPQDAQLFQRPDRRFREPVHGLYRVQFSEVHPDSVFLCLKFFGHILRPNVQSIRACAFTVFQDRLIIPK